MHKLSFDPRTSQYACAVVVGDELVGDPWSIAYFDLDIDDRGEAAIDITSVMGPEGFEINRSSLDMDCLEQQCRDAMSDVYCVPRVIRQK